MIEEGVFFYFVNDVKDEVVYFLIEKFVVFSLIYWFLVKFNLDFRLSIYELRMEILNLNFIFLSYLELKENF